MSLLNPPVSDQSPFEDWVKSPLGQYLMNWEQSELDRIIANLFGYNAVQIGLSVLPALRNSRMQTRLVLVDRLPVSPTVAQSNESISLALVETLADLPLASESVDLLDATLLWPEALNTNLWPFALCLSNDRSEERRVGKEC